MYPSVAQRFLILILTHELLQWKCVAEFELSLEEIAFKGESIWERKKQLLLPSIVACAGKQVAPAESSARQKPVKVKMEAFHRCQMAGIKCILTL